MLTGNTNYVFIHRLRYCSYDLGSLSSEECPFFPVCETKNMSTSGLYFSSYALKSLFLNFFVVVNAFV